MACAPSMHLLRVPWVHHDELFEFTEACPTHYALLHLITMVSQMQLRTWHRAISFDGVPSNPRLPCNVSCHLEGYLCLPYESLTPMPEEITAAIDKFLCM